MRQAKRFEQKTVWLLGSGGAKIVKKAPKSWSPWPWLVTRHGNADGGTRRYWKFVEVDRYNEVLYQMSDPAEAPEVALDVTGGFPGVEVRR